MFDIQLLVRTKKYRHDNIYCFSACLIGQTHDSCICDSDSSYLPTLVVLKHTRIVLTFTLNVRLRATSIRAQHESLFKKC